LKSGGEEDDGERVKDDVVAVKFKPVTIPYTSLLNPSPDVFSGATSAQAGDVNTFREIWSALGPGRVKIAVVRRSSPGGGGGGVENVQPPARAQSNARIILQSSGDVITITGWAFETTHSGCGRGKEVRLLATLVTNGRSGGDSTGSMEIRCDEERVLGELLGSAAGEGGGGEVVGWITGGGHCVEEGGGDGKDFGNWLSPVGA